MKASVTATLRAPKNSGRVLGSAIFLKIVNLLAPRDLRISRYSGSRVDSPIDMEIVEPHGKGLGHLFDSGKISDDYPLMFAVLIALAALGILLYYVVVFLEKIFAGWAERAETQ